MMTDSRKCPACGSGDTELLLHLSHSKEYECFSCNNIWSRNNAKNDLTSLNPYDVWNDKGEDEF